MCDWIMALDLVKMSTIELGNTIEPHKLETVERNRALYRVHKQLLTHGQTADTENSTVKPRFKSIPKLRPLYYKDHHFKVPFH